MAGRIAYYGNIATQGLVLNLDAAIQGSYPKTGSTWFDISNNGNNGTLTNGPLYTGSDYGAIVFDGVDDYVQLVNSTSYKTQFPISVGVWFKAQTLANYGILIRTDNTDSSHWGISLLINTGYTLGAAYGNGTVNNAPGRRTYNSSTTINLNQWYNFTAVFPDNLTCNGYLNGQSISIPYASGGATTLAYGSGGGTIGYRQDIPGFSYFNGSISSTQIYNRALSPTEVQQNFNALRGRYGI
jgi:hypothetical protein